MLLLMFLYRNLHIDLFLIIELNAFQMHLLQVNLLIYLLLILIFLLLEVSHRLLEIEMEIEGSNELNMVPLHEEYIRCSLCRLYLLFDGLYIL